MSRGRSGGRLLYTRCRHDDVVFCVLCRMDRIYDKKMPRLNTTLFIAFVLFSQSKNPKQETQRLIEQNKHN